MAGLNPHHDSEKASRLSTAIVGCAVGVGLLHVSIFAGGAFVPELDFLANFMPALLVIGVVVWVIALVVNRRQFLLVFVLAVAPPTTIILYDLGDALQTERPIDAPRMKVITLNMWSQNADTSAAEAFIYREKPHLLLLQETSSKGDRAFLDRLKAAFRSHVSNHPRNCATHIFSAFTLIANETRAECDIVTARFLTTDEFDGDQLHVASVHVSRDKAWQAAIVEKIMTEWSDGSAVVGGDFNRTPWSWSLRRFDSIKNFDRLTHALPTWPTETPVADTLLTTLVPVLPIDHMFATRDWRVAVVRRGPDVGSDHYPVVSELVRPERD